MEILVIFTCVGCRLALSSAISGPRTFRPITIVLTIAFGLTASASADVIYSGTQDIVIQGTIETIELAGVNASWDNISLGGDVFGGNNIIPNAGVALAYSAGPFAATIRLNFGDPFPSGAIFPSGTEIISGSPPYAGDGDFYAAMLFGTFGGGPMYSVWIQLDMQNNGTPAANLTVVDWAYSNVVGETISMGAVPEPSSLGYGLRLTLCMLAGSRWRRSIRFRT
jgi:hypothetical protein